ncbi:MAG: DUF6428 family protein [Salibacteraceae bacterium]
MNVSEFKKDLIGLTELKFQLPTGELVPRHFHVTEVGQIEKRFIDCGGVLRNEKVVSFQLWEADDYDHRLHPEKLLQIIELAENKLGIEDLEIEVEYQGSTIGKFGLASIDGGFSLTNKQTDCLARDKCGVPADKQKVVLADVTSGESANTCTPGGGCC